MILNEQNFKAEIQDFEGVAMVDFYAPWCGPCQLMAPIIETLIEAYKGKGIKIGKINVDENTSLSSTYNIMSIPTILFFKNGKVMEKKNGYCSKEELEQIINNYL